MNYYFLESEVAILVLGSCRPKSAQISHARVSDGGWLVPSGWPTGFVELKDELLTKWAEQQ